MYVPVVFATVVPDDDGQHSADEDHGPSRSQTPPPPSVQAKPSQSPPPSRSQTPPTPPVQAEPSQSPPPYSNYLIILVKQTSRQIYPLFSNTLH